MHVAFLVVFSCQHIMLNIYMVKDFIYNFIKHQNFKLVNGFCICRDTKVLLISEYIYTSQTQRLISEMILTASCEL